jgi:hypothetical protein
MNKTLFEVAVTPPQRQQLPQAQSRVGRDPEDRRVLRRRSRTGKRLDFYGAQHPEVA